MYIENIVVEFWHVVRKVFHYSTILFPEHRSSLGDAHIVVQ